MFLHILTESFDIKGPNKCHIVYALDIYNCIKGSKIQAVLIDELRYTAHSNFIGIYKSRCSWGRFKNAYELLNQRGLKISMLYKSHIFQSMGKIFVWNFKGSLWNSTQISYPYTERCGFYSQMTIYELLDLRAHRCFWNAPLHTITTVDQISYSIKCIKMLICLLNEYLLYYQLLHIQCRIGFQRCICS